MSDLHPALSPMSDGHSLPRLAKPWWRSRTIKLNALVLVLAAAESQVSVLKGSLGVDAYALVAFGLPLLNAYLRAITTCPLSK